MNKDRTLTDEDVKLIVDGLWVKAAESLKLNIGSGVLGLMWKAVMVGVLIVAAYGAGLRIKWGA